MITSASSRTGAFASNATDRPRDRHHLQIVGAVADRDRLRQRDTRSPRAHSRSARAFAAASMIGTDEPTR